MPRVDRRHADRCPRSTQRPLMNRTLQGQLARRRRRSRCESPRRSRMKSALPTGVGDGTIRSTGGWTPGAAFRGVCFWSRTRSKPANRFSKSSVPRSYAFAYSMLRAMRSKIACDFGVGGRTFALWRAIWRLDGSVVDDFLAGYVVDFVTCKDRLDVRGKIILGHFCRVFVAPRLSLEWC